MSRVEKIIIVVLGLISVSLLGFIIRSWTSQTATAVAAPGPERTAATVTPPLQNAVSPPPTGPLFRAAKAIRANLIDPDSAKVEDVDIIQTPVGDTVPGNFITICGRVNAKNKFGGYVGSKSFIYREVLEEPYQLIIAKTEDADDGQTLFIKSECLKDKLEAEKKMK
jgi:hypothetical protein